MGQVMYIWGDEETAFAYLDSIENIKDYFKMGLSPREVLNNIKNDFADDEERPSISEAQIMRYAEVRLGAFWRKEYRLGRAAEVFPFDKLKEAIKSGEIEVEWDNP